MTRPNILAAVQAQFSGVGRIYPTAVAAVREAWEADRRALEAAESEIARLKARVAETEAMPRAWERRE